MKTITNPENYEGEIKKSKFLSFAYNVSSENEIAELLKSIKTKHPKATHVCFGYVLQNTEKFSDDGEPVFTAGKPILDTIKKQHLTNVLVVVVRYFGGVLLGAGGLIRAYSNSANKVLALSKKVQLKNYDVFSFSLPYEIYNGIFEQLLLSDDVKLLNAEFLENINVKLAITKNSENINENVLITKYGAKNLTKVNEITM